MKAFIIGCVLGFVGGAFREPILAALASLWRFLWWKLVRRD